MKKVALICLALAGLGVLLGFVLLSHQSRSGSTSSPVATKTGRGTTSGTPRSSAHDSTSAGLSRVDGMTIGNRSIKVSSALARSSVRPYFRRVGNSVVTPQGTKYPIVMYHETSMPNDPSANQSWVTLANIDGAWSTPRGSSPTLLAIVDTGFDLEHEEFQGRWYTNPNEVAGNGIDDDGNGLVDDVHGWNFADNNNNVQAQGTGRHGTFVTGVAAATGNNGKGIAGVDWGTTILPIQALSEDGTGYNSDVANGIIYAADQGADVINLSLGSTVSDDVVRQAVDYAISKGSIVVAAAGNDGCNCMIYPANYPETLAVGATDDTGQPASFSSYGANLDIMAPGVNLYTTDWQPTDPTSAYAGGISGTSLATPIISGLLTRLKSFEPTATPLQLIADLTETTNRLTLGSSVSRSDQLGFGLVDGGAATTRMTTPYSPATISKYGPISFGQTLSPSSPAEKSAGNAAAYACNNGRPGTTPVYDLYKSGSQELFTVSPAEMEQASAAGYGENTLGYACMTMPEDSPGQVVPATSLYKIWDLNGSR